MGWSYGDLLEVPAAVYAELVAWVSEGV